MRRKIKFHCVSMQKQQQNINLSFDNLSHKSWKAFLSGYKMKMWCLLIKDIESMQVKHLANEWLNNLFFTFGLIFLILSTFSKHQEGEPYTVSKLPSCALYKGWDSFCRHSVLQRLAGKHEVIFCQDHTLILVCLHQHQLCNLLLLDICGEKLLFVAFADES